MLQIIINDAKAKMNDLILHFESELKKISTGFATPSMLDGITADYYGTQTPIEQMATITCPTARQIVVKPFDKTSIKAIVNSINAANIGLNANNSGDLIRITVPTLTEEIRTKESKKIGEATEKVKITIRQIRQTANNKIKSSEATEDDKKNFTEDVQELVNEFNDKIDKLAKEKEHNILEL